MTNIAQAEPATARPAAPRVGEPLTPENGELSVRFEMKLDMKVEKSEDGRLVLVVDPDSKPHVSLNSSPGQLTFAIGGGNGALPRGEERAQADVCIEEKVPMPEARPRIVEPAPSPEELLQQMDELMKGFPKGGGEDGR